MSSVGFKFGDSTDKQPKSVSKVSKAEPYIVAYIDQEGKEQARICFRIPKSSTTFILKERINREPTVLPAHEWFHQAFVDKLRSDGFENDVGESVESI